MAEDAELLSRYAMTSDAEAFAVLVDRHADVVYNVALRITQNMADAEDVAQQCFLQMAQHAGTIVSSLPLWLHQLAKWRSLNLIKARKTRQTHEETAVEELALQEPASNWEQLSGSIDEAIDKLPDDLRLILVLYFLERKNHEDIARLLNMSRTTVRRRCEEAVDALREELRTMDVPVPAMGLGVLLLEHGAVSAPATLKAGLVKIALAGFGNTAGTGAGGASAGKAATLSAVKTGVIMKSAAMTAGVAVLIGVGVVTTERLRADAGSDWPQWRGPNRNGVVAASPKLLDSWPKEGPKLLWKSELIPSGTGGGCGSVTVAGGKAFVYVHWRKKGAGKIVVTDKMLNDLGWMDGVPDDVAKKVDEARRVRGDIQGEKLDVYIKAFMATLDADTAAKYGAFAQKRISDTTLGWPQLVSLAAIKGKEYDSFDDLIKGKGEFMVFAGDDKYNAFRDSLVGQGQRYDDSIVCLNADTGKEMWKKEFPGSIPTTVMCMYIGGSSTPAVWENKVYATGSAGVYCLNVKDGSVVWQAKTRFSNSSPLVHKGVVYCMVPELTAFDAKTGKVLWVNDAGLQSEVTSVAAWNSGGKDYIVGCNNSPKLGNCMFCVEAATGKKVWIAPGAKSGSSTPTICGDIAIVNQQEPGTMAYKMTPESVTYIWGKDCPDNRGASLLISDGYVYSTSGRYYSTPLRCFELKTGNLMWTAVGDYGGNAMSASPVLADGKIIAHIKDAEEPCHPGAKGASAVMFKATADRFEDLGQFLSEGASGTSPTVANGKLYVRQVNAVACWDIAQHGPYVEGTTVKKDEIVFNFKQADGGLSAADSADGAIKGLVITDASGIAKPAKAKISGTSVSVDLKGVSFPVTIAYAASGNLGAKSGPSATFEWKTPRLQFQQAAGNTIALSLDRSPDDVFWKAEGTYTVTGAKVTKVEVDSLGRTVRLITDKTWKSGEKATAKYPAMPKEMPGVSAEVAFTATTGRAMDDGIVREFLMGEKREKMPLDKDDLDKTVKPQAGEKWQVRSSPGGEFDLKAWLLGGAYDPGLLMHACVYVYSEADRKVLLWVGRESPMRVTVNGQDVATFAGGRNFFVPTLPGLHGASDKIKDVELKQGWNTVLLSMAHGGHPDWTIQLRIMDETGEKPASGLRYSAEMAK